jgi:hypothetical protein
MKNPFVGILKKLGNKTVWAKVGTAALTIGSSVVPGSSAAGKAIQIFKAVRKVDEAPIAGAEKKADVLTKVSAASPEIAQALSGFVDAYVALRKAWAALKAAIASWKQAGQ